MGTSLLSFRDTSMFIPAIHNISRTPLLLDDRLPTKDLLIVGAFSNVMFNYYLDNLKLLIPNYNIKLHAVDIIPKSDAHNLIINYSLPFETYSEFCSLDKKIDGILVLTWPNTHYKYILLASQKNIPVFVEKPIVIPEHLGDLESMCNSKINIVAIDYIFDNPAVLDATQYIKQGCLGDLQSIQAALLWDLPVEQDRTWLLNRHVNGGGLGMDLAPHLIVGIEQLLENSNFSFDKFIFSEHGIVLARYDGAPNGAETFAYLSGQIGRLKLDLRVGKGTGLNSQFIRINGSNGEILVSIGDKTHSPFFQFKPLSKSITGWHNRYGMDIGYWGATKKILSCTQGFRNITQIEKDFRLNAAMQAVRLIDNAYCIFEDKFILHPYGQDPLKLCN